LIPLAKPDLQGNEKKYLLEAFDSGYLSHQGAFEDRFEREFSAWIGKPSIATSSGTAALHLALLSMGIGRGDEVIVPTMTFGATGSVVKNVGAWLTLVDGDFGMDWEQVRKKITFRTKAIIVVHLYGETCEIPSDITVPIIEDSCEALWIRPRNIGCYSFYGNKVITTGEGGMLVGAGESAKLWRDGGFDSEYSMQVAGLNYRLTNLQAAIGCAQLERADKLIGLRFENAAFYGRHLKGRGKWLFVVETPSPKELAKHLKEHGIDTRPVFTPLHLSTAFQQEGYFPKAEKMWKNGLCLPTGPHVTQTDLKRICELINGYRYLRDTSDGGTELAPSRRHRSDRPHPGIHRSM
jgi:perosamine synthetase